MTLFKPDENDKTSHMIHKIVECILFLGGKVTGDYVYSMINEDIKPTCIEACIVTFNKLCEMFTNILELEYTSTQVAGNYNNTYMKIKLLPNNLDDQEITLKLKVTTSLPLEYLKFEHELLVLESSGLNVIDFHNVPITNLVKITKLLKNKQLKTLPFTENNGARDLFIKHVELNKTIMKKKENGWVIINPDKLRVMKYSLYTQLYNDYEDVCSVCMEGFNDSQATFKTECNHLFHVPCWMRYINTNGGGGCPNCRGAVWGSLLSANNISTPAIPASIMNNQINIDTRIGEWNEFSYQVD